VRLCIWEERAAGAVRVQPERIAARQYRRFVANSTAGVDFLVNEMRTPRDRITLIPNGVEEPKLEHATDWRARLGLKLSQPLVLKVADVTRDRDHATLLRAWKIVQNSWPGGERPILALAGTLGDAYPEARRISREAGVESTIQFLGGVHEIGALIQASDLAVFSSRSEGMPNGVLECMAAGKAVIASDLPGIRDALGANADEVLASPGDPDRFAHLLMTLLRDKEKRDALGEANRARVLAEFTVDRMVERHLRLIQENLPKASRRAITITAGKDTPNAKQTAPAGRL
jgi:glycosyltransferase involved in cell wall biosynthesis